DMDDNAAAREKEHPDTTRDRGALVVPLHQELFGALQKPLLVLFAAVGFVLLIACANVANLQMARAAGRGREIAIRAALGAGRGRLLRQFLTEGVLLGLAGGAAGALLALWAMEALRRHTPIELPAFIRLGIDP